MGVTASPPPPAAPRSRRYKRLLLLLISSGLSLGAALGGLKLYARFGLGIRDPAFRYENQLGMWQQDEKLGFVNRPRVSEYCFGNVLAGTNDQGFRGSAVIATEKPPGVRRVIGIGDSVTWGAAVNERESFLGLLAQHLAGQGGGWEVINAGVVGYSSWQESLLLEGRLLAYQPDVVIFNFCVNDHLPSEDPFGNVRELHMRYLNRVLADAAGLPPERRAGVERLIEILRSAPHVWNAVDSDEAGVREAVWHWLVERPLERMAQQCRQSGVTLICLLIPPRRDDGHYRRMSQRLKPVLERQGARTVNFSSLLAQPQGELPDLTTVPPSRFGWLRQLLRLRDLDHILLLRRIDAVHEANFYIDNFHLTRRGHRIVAQELSRMVSDQ